MAFLCLWQRSLPLLLPLHKSYKRRPVTRIVDSADWTEGLLSLRLLHKPSRTARRLTDELTVPMA